MRNTIEKEKLSAMENMESKQIDSVFGSKRCLLRIKSYISSSEKITNTKKKPGGWKAMPYILGNETFERLATFGLLANFIVYLTRELHLDQVYASNILFIWGGINNFGPLLGAFISDAYIGRFWTIAFASLTSLLGMIAVTLTSWIPKLHPPPCTPHELDLGECIRANNIQLGVLFLGLGFLAIGSAGVKPCSIPFSVDQFDPTTNEGKKGINSFFNWYYTTVTLVLLVTQTVMVYIQDSVSWKLGFGIPVVCMFCSIIMFFVGTKVYVHVSPKGSIFSGIFQVLVAAYKKRKIKLPSEEKVDGLFYDPPLVGTSVSTKLPFTHHFRSLNKAAFIVEGDLNPDGSIVNKWKLATIQQVEEVKCLARIFPIWATGIISLTPVLQSVTFTVIQALKMDRHIGPKFQIPAGSIGVISLLTVALYLPLYEKLLAPSLRKITNQESGITLLQRIGVGTFFSILSMIVAGIVEKFRRDSANNSYTISVMWLAPQLILLGLCDAFNILGQIEFFNRQFPEHMRSVGNSLYYCSFAFASYINSMIVSIIHRTTRTHDHPNWLADDINKGKVDYFYYVIAFIGFLNSILFVYFARHYQYSSTVNIEDKSVDVELASHTN